MQRRRPKLLRLTTAAVAATAGMSLLAACGSGDGDGDGDGKGAADAKSPAARPGPAAGRDFSVTHIGGPTTIVEIAGARILLDPTFDEPKKYKSGLEKTAGPALRADEIGKIDAVLLSHDQHDDNLDDSGRALLEKVPVVLSTPGAHQRLGDHVKGMKSWSSHDLKVSGRTIKVTAVPALHGPDGVDRGADGEVTGFALSGKGVPTTYISGDNASVKVAEKAGAGIEKRFGAIDTAILFAGAARTPAILDNAPLTPTSKNAAAVAEALSPRKVVPVHTDSWNIYSQDMKSLVKAFEKRGVEDELVVPAPAGKPKSLR
ncbi:MBL fold metallo-hydrolase [Streptomyces kanamyceticus]|uniref:MBL fold metallo-hydrolase n=1 Tax=Streptomyces kanamyceticus TaxID=1967 RepID=A0A5J6GT51_STRKN|nr:MBL fold metallo-hydrolase [Streptomyces kanamyceticus]QEU96186.1 MBL fold metallo-hydrolase [Streptomyces kanamyceticus]